MRRFVLLPVFALLVIFPVRCNLLAQDSGGGRTSIKPFEIEIPVGRLTSEQKNKIDQRVDYLCKKISTSILDEDVIGVRKQIVSDFRLFTESEYRQYFAESCNKVFTPMMKEGVVAGRSKLMQKVIRVNSAIALVEIQKMQLLPCYTLMINSNRQDLNFLGWKAMYNLREKILSGDPADVKNYFAMVGKAFAEVDNPVVLSRVSRMIDFQGATDSVKQNFTSEVKKTLLDAIEGSWKRRRLAILSLDKKLANRLETVGILVNKIAEFCESFPEDEKTRRRGLQLMLDMAASVSRKWERENAGDLEDDSKLLMGLVFAIRSAEQGLARLSGSDKKYFEDLMEKDRSPLGAQVQMAMLVKWPKELESAGVVRPEEVKSDTEPKSKTIEKKKAG